jgi:hypothetical protein
MEQVLIMEAQHIHSVNEAGIRKVFRNIMALQQGLKAIDVITQDADFARARTYYSLFSLTPAVCLVPFLFNPLLLTYSYGILSEC